MAEDSISVLNNATTVWPFNFTKRIFMRNLSSSTISDRDAKVLVDRVLSISVPGLYEALSKLSNAEQSIIQMRFICGCSDDEISMVINLHNSTVDDRIEAIVCKMLSNADMFAVVPESDYQKLEEQFKDLMSENTYLREKYECHDCPPAIAPIYKLELPARISNALMREGIRTIQELMKRSANDILGIRTIGPVGLRILEDRLESFGYGLRKD